MLALRKVTRKSTGPVAYFCAEYAIIDTLPIYSGGLGVLAGDMLQEAASQGFVMVGVGLFYKRGFFHQHIDEDGQQETYSVTNPTEAGLELMKTATGDTLLIEVPVQNRTVYAQVWKYQVGSVPLYLLDTDHWKNSEADRLITDKLYDATPDIRIQQELVLGVGGYRALKALDISPSLYHMNEGHSAFLALELISQELRSGKTIDLALESVGSTLVFTNHTLVPAGNDLFPKDKVASYLGPYVRQSGITPEKVTELGAVPDKPGFFSMTFLALRVAGISNAVSRIHARKALEIWPTFRLKAVTNGVHLPAWVSPELQHLWDREVPAWKTQTADLNTWKSVAKISSAELWNEHVQLKTEMLGEVYARTGITLDPNALTVVWARRFATYKRPELLFSDLARLESLLFNEKTPVQIIVAGKAHPSDLQGKEIIEHIDHLAQYDLKHRAVFVDDYSISLAKFLVAGADIWLNTPVFGLEASGTSGMKAAANGALQFTVPDGWANEVDWRGLGFTLPLEKTEVELYNLFEKTIVPMYYNRNAEGVPEAWVAMMKRSIAILSPRFSASRMLQEYISLLYS